MASAASERLQEADAWMAGRGADQPILVLSASREAAMSVIRRRSQHLDDWEGGALFGCYAMTLGRLVATLAMPQLALAERTPATRLSLMALCARITYRLGQEGKLGRYAPLAGRPGLPTALADTFGELRMAELGPEDLPDDASDLRRLYAAYIDALAAQGLADRALLYTTAAEAIEQAQSPPAPLALPTMLVDVPVTSPVHARVIRALSRLAPPTDELLALVPRGDQRTAQLLCQALGTEVATRETGDSVSSSLQRVQRQLFEAGDLPQAPLRNDVTIVSAPGENRECVELARRLRAAAQRGIPFDRMAVLLREPGVYRAHLAEALRRAEIPAWFGPGTLMPHPAGRAILALLACRAEDLSARRFAEYLSLGECPALTLEGEPPAAPPADERFALPDEDAELWSSVLERLAEAGLEDEEIDLPEEEDATEPPFEPPESDETPVVAGQFRAPRRWEHLLGEAAVIGGRDRWQRRLDGLARELELQLASDDEDEPVLEHLQRELTAVRALGRFALPLMDALSTLPQAATWADWLEALSQLASRALREPDRVHAVLAELAPLGPVGPVTLDEVRQVLTDRLTHLLQRPAAGVRRAGKVFVADIESARGLSFDTVLVPGLCERRFPRKLTEDPILLDRTRAGISSALADGADRIASERLQLHLAVGAAESKLVITYPRIDLEQARPRVPSFYGLEILRAAEGRLPDFADLARRAGADTAGHRVAWPAPAHAEQAIDAAEYDLSLLEQLIRQKPAEVRGRARYLVEVNPYLTRALRFRARRWSVKKWTESDGLVNVGPEALAVLDGLMPDVKSYSPTTLQQLAACPYRFLLHAFHRLSPREEAASVETLPPLEKGSLIHQVQFLLLSALRDQGLLPVTPDRLQAAWDQLDVIIDERAAHYQDLLAPAIDRVWDEGIASIRADMRQWLKRYAEPDSGDAGWVPLRFELAYGLKAGDERDPSSQLEPVMLDCGMLTKGSIDLVERHAETGQLRATDHKSGRPIKEVYLITREGRALQPLLYALALEKLVEGVNVESGRLYYCTDRGGYQVRSVALDQVARDAAQVIADTLRSHLREGFFPAAPKRSKDNDACAWCDYLTVCGPHEMERTAEKKGDPRFSLLDRVRSMR